MKVHRINCRVYEGVMDWAHEGGCNQERLYIEGKAVIGYRSDDSIDFFSDSKEAINAVEKIIKGEFKKEKYLGVVEVDDGLAEQLISAGINKQKSEAEFQEKAKNFLLSGGFIKPQPPAPEILTIDPETLSQETKQRLEVIISRCQLLDTKSFYLKKIGNQEAAKAYAKESLEIEVEEMQERNIRGCASSFLEHHLERAEKAGADDETKKKIARKIYEQAKKERNYDTAIKMAQDYLKLPEGGILALKEMKLGHVAVASRSSDDKYEEKSYISMVKEAAEGIPQERAKEIIQQSYDYLMGNKPDFEIEEIEDEDIEQSIGDRIFGGVEKLIEKTGRTISRCHRPKEVYGRIDYLRAGQLAKEFNLGREKVLEAGRRLMSSGNYEPNEIRSGSYEMVEQACKEFELPEEMVHPAMLIFFEQSLCGQSERAKQIAEEHNLTGEEIKERALRVYNNCMGYGQFEQALAIRENFSINDSVELNDLRTLVGVTYHKREDN